MTKADIVHIVEDECLETMRAAEILDNDQQRVLVRMTIAVLLAVIRSRIAGACP